jgi:hypothetical protein
LEGRTALRIMSDTGLVIFYRDADNSS